MNEAPVPPYQSDPVPAGTPPIQPVTPITPVVGPQGSQALSTWSLILGISSVVLAIIFFIAIPAAIVAVILGIIVLVKHRPGKGKALAGIITGGAMLLIIPFIAAITIVAFNGVSQRANEAHNTAVQQEASRLLGPSSDGVNVTSPCYSYAIPAGYVYDEASVNCTTAINIPNGDALTRITVKGNTGTIGSLQDVVTMFNKTLQNGDASAQGVVDQQQLTINGKIAYYISYKDATGLLFGNYIMPDTSAGHVDQNGKTITAYTVAGYSYNSGLKALVTGVVNSLTIE
jgi:hypothetical protein